MKTRLADWYAQLALLKPGTIEWWEVQEIITGIELDV